MRFILLLLLALWQGSAFACAPSYATDPAPKYSDAPRLVLAITVDSIHPINCLRPTGYLAVAADGGTLPYTYAWSNGNTGPVSANLVAGDYTITVTDGLGATASVTASIVEDLTPPVANAGSDFIAQCANSLTSLNGTSSSTGPEFAYLWTASNGGVLFSGTTTLQPQISHTGTFTLKVTDTENGCTATDIVNVGAAFQPPAAGVTGGTIRCNPSFVTLNAVFNTNNMAYHWQGPDGFFSEEINPQVLIPGTYTFVLTDTVTTCTGSSNALVSIDTISPTAVAGGGGTITCAIPTVTLTGSGTPAGITYAWAGPNGFSASTQNAVVGEPGLYVLTTTRTSNGCTASSDIDVASNTVAPTANAGVSGILTCSVTSVQLQGSGSPAGVTYSWSGPNGFNVNAQNPPTTKSGVYVLTVSNPQNGCTGTASVTVEANTTAPGATATGGVKTCANPIITLNVTSSTPGVSYFWNGPSGFSSNLQNPETGLFGGYSVTVTNPVNGCTSTATANVTQNLTPPTVQAVSATVTCNNPNPLVSATSQTPGATFSWSGPNGFSANIPNPPVSEEGTYIVTATNPVNGCTGTKSIYVFENIMPPFVYAGEDRSINCVFASILANPLGTSTGNNFTYQWTTWNGNIVSGANSLYARFDTVGNYTLTVKNTQNGCTSADSMEVFQATPVTANASQLSAPNCNGGTNGSAKATASGGNGIFSYIWSNGANTQTASNLAAGTYTVTVTDGETCSATATATVTQPTAVKANLVVTDETQAGLNNGQASVAPTGGTPSYTIKWSTGATTTNIGALPPGEYFVTITDSKGCTVVESDSVRAVSCAVTGNINAGNVTCFGANNGSATVSITGGGGFAVYAWSNGANTQTASNLAPGTYDVTATGSNGCSIVLSTQITGPTQMTVSVSNKVDIDCPDVQNGTATVTASGGTAPYTYAWTTGSNSFSVFNLGGGSFTCTVTDANGCTETQTVQIAVTDSVAPQLTVKDAEVNLDANGQVVLAAALFDNGSVDNCSITSWAVSPMSFDCSQTGTHTVTLTASDQNGNSSTATATVTIKDNTAPVLACPQNVNVSVCASTLAYDLPLVSDNCATTGTATLVDGLPSGSAFPIGTTTQNFSFTDAGGNTGTCSFTITVSDSMSLSVSTVATTCAAACDGTATIAISGGVSPFQYTWDNGLASPTATALCAGNFGVTVTDASGCTESRIVSVTAGNNPIFSVSANTSSSSCTGSCNGSILLGISGGNNPIVVSWDNGQTGFMLDSLCPGTYNAVVTDANGCTVSQDYLVGVLDAQIPVLVCPASITVGFCNAAVAFALPLVSDDCPVDTQNIQLTSGLASGTTFPMGTTAQIFRYTDPGGNTGQCSFTITVGSPMSMMVNGVQNDPAGTGSGSIAISVSGGNGPYSFDWSRNGQPFATTEDLDNLFQGVYVLTITDADGCTITSIPIPVGNLVDANEPDVNLRWSLYPNPATSELYLQIGNGYTDEMQLEIFDAAGRRLRTQAINPIGTDAMRLDLDGLPDGWLLFRLSGEKGYQVKKLMKTR